MEPAAQCVKAQARFFGKFIDSERFITDVGIDNVNQFTDKSLVPWGGIGHD